MKKILFLLATLGTVSYASINTIGVAAGSIGLHDAKRETRAIPLVNMNYENLFINGGTIGLTTYDEPDFKINIVAEPLAGYFNGWSVKGSKFEEGYEINDRKSQFMGGLSMNFDMQNDYIGEINYLFGEKGSKGEFNISRFIFLNDRVSIIPTASFKYYQSEYLKHFVGVSGNEVLASSRELKKYSPGDSFSAGLNIATEVSITEQLITSLFIGIEYYGDKISNSPIVEKDTQVYGGLGMRYSF